MPLSTVIGSKFQLIGHTWRRSDEIMRGNLFCNALPLRQTSVFKFNLKTLVWRSGNALQRSMLLSQAMHARLHL